MNEQVYISLAEGLRQVAMTEARGYIANADDVEDVAQEVMLRLWEKRAEIQSDSKMLRAYVATMARNVCKDRQKVKRRHPLLRFLWVTKDDDEEVYEIPSYDTPHKRMEATESVTVYRQALKRLPYNWQKILEEVANVLEEIAEENYEREIDMAKYKRKKADELILFCYERMKG